MPRYYFNLREGDELIPDKEGVELPTISGARAEAFRGLADCVRDAICNISSGALAIEVADAAQNVLFVAKLVFATELVVKSDAFDTVNETAPLSELSPIRKRGEPNGIKHRNLAS